MNNAGLIRMSAADIDLCRVSIAIAIISTVAFRNWPYIVYAAQALMILMVLARWTKTERKETAGVGWYAAVLGFFALWCLISSFWAVSPDRALSASVGVVQFVLLGFFLTVYVRIEDDSRFVLGCLAWSGLILLLVLVCVTPGSLWLEAVRATTDIGTDQNRIGYTVGYHPNTLGYLCAICIVLWFYKYFSSSKKKRYFIPIVALFVVMLFTKSRLSIVVMAVGVMTIWLLSANGAVKRMATVIAVLLCAVLGIWGLFNIPVLYDLVGFRFAGMLGSATSVDASTATREEMIRVALSLFEQNILTGVGFANYAIYYFYDFSGHALTYAHSNYAELLADLGLPGAVSYYAIPVWTLITLIRTVKSSPDRNTHILYISLLAVLLVADYSSISYTNDFIQLLWASAFAFCVNRKRDFDIEARNETETN